MTRRSIGLMALLVMSPTVCRAQATPHRELSITGGYARSIQMADLPGGLSIGLDLTFGRRVRYGITGAYYNLGSSKTDTTAQILLPSPQTARIISENARYGWNVGLLGEVPSRLLAGRVWFVGSVFYQRYSVKDRFELRDSTNAPIQPITVARSTASGVGAMAGLAVTLVNLTRSLDTQFSIKSNLLVFNGEGLSVSQFFNVGVRLRYSF